MTLTIDDEFKGICRRILGERRTPAEWAEVESPDMFQTGHYCGGFDVDEEAFCFSHYDSGGNESWFQVTLSEVIDISQGRLSTVTAREPD